MAEQKTILVVDDDRELVDALRSMLERKGYRVIQAHDGHQAKQAVYNQRPDLMILDMMMPPIGGASLTSVIIARSLPILLGPPSRQRG